MCTEASSSDSSVRGGHLFAANSLQLPSLLCTWPYYHRRVMCPLFCKGGIPHLWNDNLLQGDHIHDENVVSYMCALSVEVCEQSGVALCVVGWECSAQLSSWWRQYPLPSGRWGLVPLDSNIAFVHHCCHTWVSSWAHHSVYCHRCTVQLGKVVQWWL